jgi:hypothetical protein
VFIHLCTSVPTSGQCRFAVLQGQDFVLIHRCEHVILRLKPYEFGLEIPNAPLETPHLRDHPGVGTADVAE